MYAFFFWTDQCTNFRHFSVILRSWRLYRSLTAREREAECFCSAGGERCGALRNIEIIPMLRSVIPMRTPSELTCQCLALAVS